MQYPYTYHSENLEHREEFWNIVTHALGFIISIPATIHLIVIALRNQNNLQLLSFAIFGGSLILLFLMSTLLHGVTLKYKFLFARFDHAAIYILIAGTYTPFLLLAIGGKLGAILLITIWLLAIFGVCIKFFWFEGFEKLSVFFYIFMGWLILFAIKPMYQYLGLQGFIILFLGGVLYTFGTIFYAWRSLPYGHAIWHLFVLAGCAAMYYCVLHYLT